MKKFSENENGMVVIEATVVFPIIMVMTLMLYVMAFYIFQGYVLQAACNLALTQVSTTLSDDRISMGSDGPENTVGVNSPYDVLFNFASEKAEIEAYITDAVESKYFYSNASGNAPLDVTVDINNYIIYSEIVVEINAQLTLPTALQIAGIDHVPVYYYAKKYVDNQDEFIRNVDFAFLFAEKIDEKYSISDTISPYLQKVKDVYNRLMLMD